MKVYLAGPMDGVPEFNHPAFHEATARLRAAGHAVHSPAEHDEERGIDVRGLSGSHDELDAQGFTMRELLLGDLAWICLEAEAVVLMPGSEKSLGARAESAVAEALGLRVELLDDFLERHEDRDI